MKKKIKKWLFMVKRKLAIWYVYHIKGRRMSPKGLYLCYYIANKYLLNVNPTDFNQEYEDEIANTLERMRLLHLFERLNIPENRADAAFFTMVKLLIIATPEDRETAYGFLKDWPQLPTLKKYVKAGIVIL